MQLSSVVVGFDFSPAVERAATWVHAQLAPDARMTLVHAVELDPLPRYLDARFAMKEALVAEAIERATHRLLRRATTLGLPETDVVARTGRPHELLFDAAEAATADLLVIGAHRDTTRPWQRIGSTTERLLRKATASILIARGTMDNAPQRILVSVDDAGVTPTLLRWAGAIRRQFDARLLAVHVLSNAAFSYMASIDAGQARSDEEAHRLLTDDIGAEARRWLDEVALAAGATDKLEVAIPHGSAGDEILACADDFGADLIMIGRYGLGRLVPALLGSVLSSVVHGARCPVLVVNDAATTDL